MEVYKAQKANKMHAAKEVHMYYKTWKAQKVKKNE